MTGKKLRIFTAIISGILAFVVGWSIAESNFIVPIVAVVLAIVLSYSLRRRVKEVTRDERTTLLYEKAAGATIRFCVPLAAIVAFILFLFREGLSAEAVAAAYVLAYFCCVLLIAHLAFYSYYSRKH